MIQQQLLQIVFWLGVIISLPTFYRFVYAGSALLWRKVFPTKVVELRFYNANRSLEKTVTLRLNQEDGKKIVDLIDDATNHGHSKK
ncbi:hypothetical protein ACAY42_000685 [Citrobacter freundii]|uniref:hypothetical protein n=1 Tax=Citrobacter freundii TaxID=546 RepID=UPI0008FD2D21|nr:hypothetical protein [Citrobacter freundii]EDW4700916.1 hypothetical protein [Salmonella enterica subsp. enterica]HAU6860887.1 hypothetical protein [Salmonella enterica subsp. enterica serovar Senftenberg]AYL71154.1 hypothetical protein CUC51_10680 [Citrobacter freundii]EJG2197931.1 hypothetical protein [Citrobacter freundii]EKA7901646.1 hypothetical protein [Citrobacter freundii]